MQELVPGVHVVRLASPFDAKRHIVHGAEVGGTPLTIRAHAAPWSLVVSFPSSRSSIDAEGLVGVVTRAQLEVLSGDGTLAFADSKNQLFQETALARTVPHTDLLTDNLNRYASIALRVGAAEGELALRLRGFRCFGIVDTDGDTLRSPAGARLAPMRHWNRFYGRPEGDLQARIRHLRFEKLASPRRMGWLLDLEISITPHEQISRAVFVSGLYEPCTAFALQRLLRRGQTFIDVGAHVGLFTLLAARWVGPEGRVISLEPSPREYTRLLDHIERNRLANVTALRLAAGARPGTAVLHVADSVHTGLNTLAPTFMYQGVNEDHREIVEVHRLDDLLAAHGGGTVHMMKIDVEGGERDVIEGARHTIERDRPVLVIEVTGPALAPDDPGRRAMEAFLRSCGYLFAAIDAEAAEIVPAAGLTGTAENFVAAPPDALDALLTQDPFARDFQPRRG